MYKFTGRVGRVENWVVIKEKRLWGWKKIAEFSGEKAFDRAEKYVERMVTANLTFKEKKSGV